MPTRRADGFARMAARWWSRPTGSRWAKASWCARTTAAALAAIDDAMERRRFGAAGARVVIEERLVGEELSFFALCDGERRGRTRLAQDHKAAFDGDRGPNTGGMGAYTPVPHFDAAFEVARDERGGVADARRDARRAARRFAA